MAEIENIHIKTIGQMHQLLGISKPKHPLFSIVRFEDISKLKIQKRTRMIADFYQITLKKEHPCKIQYGQNMFDFDEGIISCFSPKQVSFINPDFELASSGWQLSIHPDFFHSNTLGQKIKGYGFFDYSVSEALILSEDEQQSVETIFLQIEKEAYLPIDKFSQEVLICNIELLLIYFNRYYNRQFLTRKAINSELLKKFENLLNTSFAELDNSPPTVSDLAFNLNLSPKYLSDCLKQLTGQTVQQHIHDKIIEKAKERLSTTDLTVSEIAYELGFEFPQSFSKLFKAKTNLSPLKFRHLFN